MPWAKIKFFHNSMLGTAGSTLTATSTASGDFNVSYINNRLEVNFWKAGGVTPPQTIHYDAGAGNSYAADFVVVYGHNLFSAGASVYLEWSDNDADWTEAWSATPAANTIIHAEFTATAAHRYWRLRLYKSPGNFTEAPFIAIGYWGLKTELDYVSASFDPNEEEKKANVNLSHGGYMTGIYTQFSERTLQLRFEDADSTLYNKIKTWWSNIGQKNFFVGYDTTNDPTAVYLMRSDPRFSNPFKMPAGAYRDVTVNLRGRKE